MVSVKGHYVARDIRVINGGRPFLTIHVDVVEGLSDVADAIFVPPSDAIGPMSGPISMKFANLPILNFVAANYPERAKRAGVQGTVIVRFTIGKSGLVASAEPISGPDLLQDAAVQCVRQWKFRPFLVLGEPVEVETETHVDFTLAN